MDNDLKRVHTEKDKGGNTKDKWFRGASTFDPLEARKQIKAYMDGGAGVMDAGGGGGMDFTSALWYSPEMTMDMWLLPKSRLEILKWIRIYYNLNPYVMSIINMHQLYPFSKFDIITENDEITAFYRKAAFNRNFNLFHHILDMSLAYWKFGEAITLGNMEKISVPMSQEVDEEIEVENVQQEYADDAAEKAEESKEPKEVKEEKPDAEEVIVDRTEGKRKGKFKTIVGKLKNGDVIADKKFKDRPINSLRKGDMIVSREGNKIRVRRKVTGNVELYMWRDFILFEPEVINIEKTMLSRNEMYTMTLTDDMKKAIVKASQLGHPVHPTLVKAVEENQKSISLEGQYVSKIINKTDPSAVRGTSPIQCLLRVMIFEDKINSLKMFAIDKYRYPIEIWKIGDLTIDPPIIPDDQMLMDFEVLIKSAKNNPPFALFVPPFVNYQAVGFSTEKGMFDYKEDYEWIRDAVMVGLGVNKNLITGEGPSFSNIKQLTLFKLFMMYQAVRDLFEEWMIYEFFYPLAEKNEFIDEDGQYILPTIKWHKDLEVDQISREEALDLWKEGLISTESLLGFHKGIDAAQEEVKLKQEIGSIWDDGKRIRNKGLRKQIEKFGPDYEPTMDEEPDAGGGPAPAPEEGKPGEPEKPEEPAPAEEEK